MTFNSRGTVNPRELEKAVSLFIVTILVCSLVIPMVGLNADPADGEASEDIFYVTYDLGDRSVSGTSNIFTEKNAGVPSKVKVKYYGASIAEYNPQFWKGNFTGEVETVWDSNGNILDNSVNC